MSAATPNQNNSKQQKLSKTLILFFSNGCTMITSLAGISWLWSNKTKTLLQHKHFGALFLQAYTWNKNCQQACTDFTQTHHDLKCNTFDLIAKNLCSTWLIVYVYSTQISKGVMQKAHSFFLVGPAAHSLTRIDNHNLNHSSTPALIWVVQHSWEISSPAHSAYSWFKATS